MPALFETGQESLQQVDKATLNSNLRSRNPHSISSARGQLHSTGQLQMPALFKTEGIHKTSLLTSDPKHMPFFSISFDGSPLQQPFTDVVRAFFSAHESSPSSSPTQDEWSLGVVAPEECWRSNSSWKGSQWPSATADMSCFTLSSPYSPAATSITGTQYRGYASLFSLSLFSVLTKVGGQGKCTSSPTFPHP